MTIINKNLSVDMYDCKAKNLSDIAALKSLLHEIAILINLPLSTIAVNNEADNFSLIALLPESHIAIHIYPDTKYVSIDLYSNKDVFSPSKVLNILKNFFKPDKLKVTHIKRADFGAVKDMKPTTKVKVAPMRRIKNTSAKFIKILTQKSNKK